MRERQEDHSSAIEWSWRNPIFNSFKVGWLIRGCVRGLPLSPRLYAMEIMHSLSGEIRFSLKVGSGWSWWLLLLSAITPPLYWLNAGSTLPIASLRGVNFALGFSFFVNTIYTVLIQRIIGVKRKLLTSGWTQGHMHIYFQIKGFEDTTRT